MSCAAWTSTHLSPLIIGAILGNKSNRLLIHVILIAWNGYDSDGEGHLTQQNKLCSSPPPHSRTLLLQGRPKTVMLWTLNYHGRRSPRFLFCFFFFTGVYMLQITDWLHPIQKSPAF